MLFSFFFFSSRRRHTRYWRDWSSDVCSSDLEPEREGVPTGANGCDRQDRGAPGRRRTIGETLNARQVQRALGTYETRESEEREPGRRDPAALPADAGNAVPLVLEDLRREAGRVRCGVDLKAFRNEQSEACQWLRAFVR